MQKNLSVKVKIMATQFLVNVKPNREIGIYSYWFYGQELIVQLPLYKNAFEPYHVVDPFTVKYPLCQFLVSVCQSKEPFKVNSFFKKKKPKCAR